MKKQTPHKPLPKSVKWLWGIVFAPFALLLLLLLLTAAGLFGRLPSFEELENPKSKPPKPHVDKRNEGTSNDASRSGTPSCSTSKNASTNSTTSSTIKMRKKLRHPHESTNAPPMVGPMLGANPIAMPEMPIAVPFCPFGKRIMAMD